MQVGPHLLGASLAFALVFALACDGTESPPKAADRRADPEAAFRSRLGREWRLVRLGDRDIPPPPGGDLPTRPGDIPPGARPTIRFVAEPRHDVGGRSFCNGWGGPWAIHGDSLRIGQIMSSAVGCDGPDSLETRFFRSLLRARRYELDSATLVVVAEDGTRLTFVPVAPAGAAAPLP